MILEEKLSAILITQGLHKFYSLTMPIELIADSCSPNPRASDPIAGFQRNLDEKRADSIADYIRTGGTIPSSIILSAQSDSNFIYDRKTKTVKFDISSKSFLILDGQHRVYGFRKLLNDGIKYRVPVIIYNELSSVDEARIFIDINTLQKPVPRELLLDIKRMAERENHEEIMLEELFSLFESSKNSSLLNMVSRFEKTKGKISKVTFYDAMKGLIRAFEIDSINRLYNIVNAYLSAAIGIAEDSHEDLKSIIYRATVFKILIGHAKSVIAIIGDNNPNNLELVSEHKKYLSRSLPGSYSSINNAKAYLKEVETLDKKLISKSVRI